MIDFWLNLERKNVFQSWDTGFYDGLFYKSGLFNNSHFMDYIEEWIPSNSQLKRKLSVGAFDLNKAKFVRYNESIGYQNFVQATKGSSAFPFFFETVKFDGKTLSDGGIFMNLDVAAAVSWCMEIVNSTWDITIDIVLTNEYNFIDADDYSNSNSLSVAWRVYQAWKLVN